MDVMLLRRALPLLYALAIVISLLFARSALLAVLIIGAVLIGLTYALTGGMVTGGRERNRNRNRYRG